jgi:ABC-2 type transport system ATP-binding protein
VPLERYGEVVGREENRVTLRVARDLAPDRTARLVRDLQERLADLSLEDPPIEEVIDRVFSAGEPFAATAADEAAVPAGTP